MPVDSEGRTAQEWLGELFEFEYCAECSGDVEDYDAVLISLGAYGGPLWFARCRVN